MAFIVICDNGTDQTRALRRLLIDYQGQAILQGDDLCRTEYVITLTVPDTLPAFAAELDDAGIYHKEEPRMVAYGE